MRADGGFYLDVLDDGITPANLLAFEIGEAAPEAAALNHARFQVLLGILFGRTAVVPEVWAISSPLFFTLFQEVQDGYKEALVLKRGPTYRHVASPPPFTLSVFDRGSASLGVAYLEAFAFRLEQGRRVECLRGLTQAGMTEDDPVRQRLAAVLRRHAGHERAGTFDPKRLRREIEDTLAAVAAPSVADDARSGVARGIARVAQCASDQPRRLAGPDWSVPGETRFRNALAGNVTLVRDAVEHAALQGSMPAAHQGELDDFRALFEEARDRGIAFSDVMGMQRLLKDRGAGTRRMVTAFGRYVLNRAYSTGLGAQATALTFDHYTHGQTSDGDRHLMGVVAQLERQRNPYGIAFPALLDVAVGRPYTQAHRIDWRRVWANAAEVALDPRWEKQRRRITDRLMQTEGWDDPSDPRLAREILEPLFDRINGAFHDLAFRLDGRGGGMGKVVADAAGTVKALPKAGDLREMGAAIPADAAKVADVYFGGVLGLLSKTAQRAPHLWTIKLQRLMDAGSRAGADIRRRVSNLIVR